MNVHVFFRKGSRKKCRDKTSQLLVCRCCAFAPEHSKYSDFQYCEHLTINNNNQNLPYASIKDLQPQLPTMVTLRSAAPGHERVIWTNGGLKATSITTANNRPSTSNKNLHVTRHMAKEEVANRVTKKNNTRTKATSSKVTRRQEKKNNPSAAPARRSNRLAQRTTQAMGEGDLPTDPTADVLADPTQTTPHASQPTSAPQAPESVDENPPASATELDAEITMEEYMDSVDLRIHAAETRELLKAALEAPFWYDEYPRALYTEAIRVYRAISSGRINSFQEALQIPLEDHFWAEEVAVNPVVSKIESSVFE